MAAKIYRINYKSDFILTMNSDAGWEVPFCIKFWTSIPSRAYYVGYDGETYTHCAYDPSEPTKLVVQFDDHHLPIGDLKFQISYHFTVDDFPNNTEDEVFNETALTTEIDGETFQVMLDFNGETAPGIDFSLPSVGVTSVNGKIGVVTLTAEDVGAQPTIADLATIRSGAAAGSTAVQPAALQEALAGKQDTISDLSTIRSGAAAGATAVQSAELQEGLATKQDVIEDLATIRSGAAAGATAVQPAGLTPIESALQTIEALIPSAATSQNKLADMSYVDNKVSTSTANFVGTFETLAELQAVQNPTNNDYGFVIETDALGNEYYDRYKFNGTTWLFEYKVESTPFTAEQWAAIQSGITSALVTKLNALPTATELSTQLAAKQDTISDLSTIRSGAAAGATAVQPAAMNTALAAKQDTISDLSTIRSGAAAGATAVQPTAMNNALATKQDTISTVNVTVDNNTGTPSGTASVSGSTLSLSFQNLKGATGATGATGPQGPQGERGLPGESGVTGDVSGFTVRQTIDPSATYGATDIAGAATVQATNQELTELEGKFPQNRTEYSFSDFTDGKFFNTSQSVGTTIPAVSTNSSFAYLLLDCEEGQNFHIVGVGGNSARLWCFVDASNKKISSSDAGAGNTTTGTDIVAPANAAQVYIQISKSSTPNYSSVVSVSQLIKYPYSIDKYIDDEIDSYNTENVEPLKTRVTALENLMPPKISEYDFSDFTDGKFFNTSQSVGTTIPAVSTNSSFAYLLLDCEEGQNFHIVGVGGNSARLWCFVDASNKKISSSDAAAGNTTTGTDITAPANAAQVYIQIDKSSTTDYNSVVKVVHTDDSQKDSVVNYVNREFNERIPKTTKSVKILAIGNSYSVNAMCYVPWILDNIAPEVDYTFGVWLYGGATLEHHYNIISSNTTGNNYLKMKKGDTKWNAASGGSTISALMDNEDWDIVTLQQASAYHADYSTYQPYLNGIVKSLFGYAERAIRFGWVLTPSKETTLNASVTDYENISAAAQRVINETAVDLIIPVGTALQNARTVPALQALGDSGNMTYQQHLQSGIPCLVEAYAYALSILREIGMNYRSVYGDPFTPDSAWETNTGMTSLMYGSPVGLTDANRMAAQICAIQALKEPYEITDCASIV